MKIFKCDKCGITLEEKEVFRFYYRLPKWDKIYEYDFCLNCINKIREAKIFPHQFTLISADKFNDI